jgi:dTDP-4-dehydrorhamnose 3,5-epimerase
MRFIETSLPGIMLVEGEPSPDARGSFVRLHCEREFGERGLAARMVQTSLSRTTRRGTVRGLHFQWPPAAEAKLVRCLRGRIFDVVVDLRPDSPGFGRHFCAELSADEPIAVYIPPGFAHGFQTLMDDCDVLYQMSDFYVAELGSGVRWNDPAFGIAWPLPCAAIHERDAAYTDFDSHHFATALAAHGRWRSPA